MGPENGIYSMRQGGSLERDQRKIKISGGAGTQQTYAASDSEYGHIIVNTVSTGSPSTARKSLGTNSSSPSPTPNNSKSLPKGTSSLNYGLMMEKIQQKRQQRQYSPKINDGSLSDSNYISYERSSSPYSWLQPASTYTANNMVPTVGTSNMQEHQVYGRANGGTLVPPSDAHGDLGHAHLTDILGSNESLNSVSSSIQQARANSLTKARLLLHQQQINRSASTGNATKAPPITR